MKLLNYHHPDRGPRWGLAEGDEVFDLAADNGAFLSSVLQWPDPVAALAQAWSQARRGTALSLRELEAGGPTDGLHLHAPLDLQEVWAAGVTYQRSKVARMEESEKGATFYDMVYDADRPELFMKGGRSRTTGPGGVVRIREDSAWNVPEPELAVLVSRDLRIVGYTVGNDVSSRDIEGANPLYLPQAKVYRQSCALGPAILLDPNPAEHREFGIRLAISRGGAVAFSGETSTGQMKRHFGDLVSWLGRDNVFPDGVFLLTGTGVVPGDDFTLQPGDVVEITVEEIGTLRSTVVQG